MTKINPKSPHSTSCHLLRARITSRSSRTHPPTVTEALEARWLPRLFCVMKEIQIIQFHQGVNLHIFNFSHKHWTSRPWGTADHRFWTWKNRANQTEERIHGWCLIRCRTLRTRSFFPTSTLCLPRPESIGLSTPDPVPSEPPWVLLSSTHVTSSSSSLWLGVPKHKIVLTQLSQQEGQVLADVTHGWLWLSSNQQNRSVKHLWKLTWKTLTGKRTSKSKCDCNNCRKCFRISSNLHCCSKNSHFRG